jgi:pimeloyl-ACP methyl ester carboxylesterase
MFMENLKIYLIVLYCLILSSIDLKAQQITGINLEGIPYPYNVKYDTIQSQRQHLAMAYMYETVANPRGTVMLFHGKNFNGSYWGETIKNLLMRGYNVFIPDQIGFGKSSKPVSYQYSFQVLSENTRIVMDKLKIGKVILLGHSMGGMLATRFSLMYPHRVQQLILENMIGLEDWQKWVFYKDVEFFFDRELKKSKDGVRQYMLTNYFHNEWKPSYDELLNLQTAFLQHPEYPVLAWNSALTYDMIITQPVVYEFRNLKVPTVLIIGQLDRTALGKDLVSKEVAAQMGNYPQLGKEIAAKIPSSRLIELPGLGHIPHVEDFDEFFKVLMEVIKR